jgi:hypothetical protein
MAAGLQANGHNAMLDHLASVGIYVSAHTADPGATGTSEVVGGSYARQSITWNTAAASALDSSNAPVIPIPAATTITHIGLFSALTSGTFYGSWDITDEVFGSAGNYTLTDADWDLVAV